MEKFFKLSISPSKDNKHLFCNCSFLFGDVTVGDYEQTVLAETLRLSLKDLISRLSAHEPLYLNGNIEDKFYYLSDNIKNSCLPTCIESFDGDFGILFRIDNKDFLVIRQWRELDLLKIILNKNDYIKGISLAIKKLDNALGEHERRKANNSKRA